MSKSKKIIIGVCAAAVLAVAVVAGVFIAVNSGGGPYVGKVLEDGTNKPVANVSVTDGRHVVKTDENGEFKLKGYRKTHFITITTPSGYVAKSYYIPVSKETESYDFYLVKNEKMGRTDHSFIQISDTEVGKDGAGEWLDGVKNVAEESDASFLVHTGDICYEDGLKSHIKDMNSETMGLPVYYSLGNHDYVEGKYGEELFESIYGPTWYSFDVGKVHYVVTPIYYGDYKSYYSKNDPWRWLANDLENISEDMQVVIFNHTIAPGKDYVIPYGTGKLDLKKHNILAWLYGHYHYNYVSENNGVVEISAPRPDCGGIDSSVGGTRVINVTDGKISTRMYYNNLSSNAAQPENAQWSTQLDGNCLFTDTLVVGDKVFIATAHDDYPMYGTVYCLNANDGSVIWEYKTKNSVKNNLAFSDGKLVVQDTDANVYIFNSVDDADNVTVVKVPVGTSLNTCMGVCVEGSTAYVGSGSAVSAVDINSGKILWSNERGKGENSPSDFVIAGDKLIVSSNWDALVALDKKTGKQLWKVEDEDIRFRTSTPVALDENTLVVASDDAIMTVDINKGKIVSKTNPSYGFDTASKMLVENNIAYIPTTGKGVIAFDLQKKTVLWEMKTGKSLVYTAAYSSGDISTVESSIVSVGDNIMFGASDGYVYTVKKSDGSVVDKKNAGSAILGTPAFWNNHVVVSDFSGRVTMFK